MVDAAAHHQIDLTLEDICSACLEINLVEAMADCSDLGAFLGLCCADCEDELVSDGHWETCTCGSCERQRAKADRQRRKAEAGLRVGGGGWGEDGA